MATPILVVGHKNPDNDAICAAIGYAWLKNELAAREVEDGEEPPVYMPARLGPLPPETYLLPCLERATEIMVSMLPPLVSA